MMKPEPHDHPERMLGDMVTGFDSLVEHVDALRAKNAELQRQLDALLKNPSTPAATEDGKPRSRSRCPVERHLSSTELPIESRAVHRARDTARQWHASILAARYKKAPPKLDLPQDHPVVEVEVEQDFTTPGATPGRLGCPFAAMMGEKDKQPQANHGGKQTPRRGRRPGDAPLTPRSQFKEDPIAAEFHSDVAKAVSSSSPPPSASGSGAKCPIRFLDQHKPEEIAQYFENHKHEIPRSHEICIKRYQSNEESIRQLDAKYGSLVNMIQGLGKKHKPMLQSNPGEEDDDSVGGVIDDDSQILDDKEANKIKRWAGNVETVQVTEPPVHEQLEQPQGNGLNTGFEEDRTPRFERDLREVRLGESPSRPWGIQIPAHVQDKTRSRTEDPAPPTSADASGHNEGLVGPSKDEKKEVPTSKGKCPVAHGQAAFVQHSLTPGQDAAKSAPAHTAPVAAAARASAPAKDAPVKDAPVPPSQSPMIFNGPVFLGYSVDEMAKLLREVPQLRAAFHAQS